MALLRFAADLGGPVAIVVVVTYLALLVLSAAVAVLSPTSGRRRDALRVLLALLKSKDDADR